MTVFTRKNQIANFKLTGKEVQESINLDKYQALAYNVQPYGPLMQLKVEAHWNDWLNIIRDAFWLKHWNNYDRLCTSSPTPLGADVNPKIDSARIGKKEINLSSIALYIYSEAVWGFGIENWLQYPWGRHNSNQKKAPLIIQCIQKAQKLQETPKYRKQLWDGPLYRGCGLMIPPEFGELDRWLEKLWTEVVDQVEFEKQQKVVQERYQRAANKNEI